MNNHLLTIYENGLHPQAKFLYALLHAYADDNGVAVVDESHVAGIMCISPARLRGYRSEINKSGYATVRLSDGNLIFTATDHQARDIARGARESDHRMISDAPAQPLPDTPTARGARENDHQVITPDAPTPPSDHRARDIARSTRESDHDGGDKGGERERERDLTPPSRGKNSLTHSFTDEQRAAVAILIDPAVGMSRYNAVRLAAQYSFDDIRAFACRWLDEDRKAGDEAGLIAYRLEAAETVPPLSRNELWQRHRTPTEIAAEEQERAESERLLAKWQAEAEQRQQAADSPAPTPQPVAAQTDLWAAVLADLTASLSRPAMETWLAGTSASYADGRLTVHAANAYAREWLRNRLLTQMHRTASRIAGRAVEVVIV